LQFLIIKRKCYVTSKNESPADILSELIKTFDEETRASFSNHVINCLDENGSRVAHEHLRLVGVFRLGSVQVFNLRRL